MKIPKLFQNMLLSAFNTVYLLQQESGYTFRSFDNGAVPACQSFLTKKELISHFLSYNNASVYSFDSIAEAARFIERTWPDRTKH